MSFIDQLGLSVPVLQAPMAGVSTPALAAAVSNAGALGAIGLGATDAAGARGMIEQVRARTERPFNVNLFVHATPQPDPQREAVWLDWLRPLFAQYGASAPAALAAPYTSFEDDPDMLAMLLALRPPVISFHFGLPTPAKVQALRSTGAILLASVTSLAEARLAEKAGMDAVIAQGVEAGGHRGVFDAEAPDDALGVFALTRILARQGRCPVVAAGGVMDGAGVAAVLELGAVAAQMGTAFVACPESAADEAYRQALLGPAAYHTRLITGISGRPARGLANRLSAWLEQENAPLPPAYPIAYAAAKALNTVARAGGEAGFGAHWAGQGAPLARAMPAAQLVSTLKAELEQARTPCG
ncbi:NAD(P)H-dependent flavin oxidoreductase [Acetobacter fabarum]|uniref:NAD(P)H-dependent flavin oxidoreductase n=1 Tax=Acetobacter fabarum TaxID=483199 RepID=UPI0020A1320F|nr:nitronate monooxygenase [Acetobacter fabarum]MCP1229015.1 nitronate monooxygenase [Acetobacter fabarum]MCP1234555.1 nitronate monooxygenase [Acetobacter fabarum]